jgi:hypothetical protein
MNGNIRLHRYVLRDEANKTRSHMPMFRKKKYFSSNLCVKMC